MMYGRFWFSFFITAQFNLTTWKIQMYLRGGVSIKGCHHQKYFWHRTGNNGPLFCFRHWKRYSCKKDCVNPTCLLIQLTGQALSTSISLKLCANSLMMSKRDHWHHILKQNQSVKLCTNVVLISKRDVWHYISKQNQTVKLCTNVVLISKRDVWHHILKQNQTVKLRTSVDLMSNWEP